MGTTGTTPAKSIQSKDLSAYPSCTHRNHRNEWSVPVPLFVFFSYSFVRAGVSITVTGRGVGGGLRIGMALGPPMALRMRISLLYTMLPHCVHGPGPRRHD